MPIAQTVDAPPSFYEFQPVPGCSIARTKNERHSKVLAVTTCIAVANDNNEPHWSRVSLRMGLIVAASIVLHDSKERSDAIY